MSVEVSGRERYQGKAPLVGKDSGSLSESLPGIGKGFSSSLKREKALAVQSEPFFSSAYPVPEPFPTAEVFPCNRESVWQWDTTLFKIPM